MTSAPAEPCRQIVLVGLSGVGKSTIAEILARRLGWPLLDTDDLVRDRHGSSAAELITSKGEPAFREMERAVVHEAAQRTPAVIATGGGAFQLPASRRVLGERGFICYLDATPGEIARRLQSSPEASDRPLLAGEDVEARLQELDAERRQAYSHADLWVPVQGLDAEAAAARILHTWATESDRLRATPLRLDRLGAPRPSAVPEALVDTGQDRYPIWIGPGQLGRLPERLRLLGLSGRVFLVSDANVIEAHGMRIAQALDGAGIPGASYIVPAGEASKTLRVADELYRWLASQRAERRDVVLALGGGVVGDLAGYVAATYLRGMPLIQAPTSTLAMNDAAIGGKVAVDLPAGKNLVGAFHQPHAVIADTDTLRTLPRRSYTEGFGEVIKHALILDPMLLRDLERHAGSLAAGSPEPEVLASVFTRSARLKALVVSADPMERGLRAILNYGHTIAHGIEAATGYGGDYLHGEAVAVGMMGAARIAVRMGLLDEEILARQGDVLRAFGLPLTAPGVSASAVLEAMRMDKKVVAGKLRFVLLEDIGRPVIRDDVPEDLVGEVVRALVASS
ncbi:MAG: 3-dehydroquinate synthase [Dehalococcoidia bacterium]